MIEPAVIVPRLTAFRTIMPPPSEGLPMSTTGSLGRKT